MGKQLGKEHGYRGSVKSETLLLDCFFTRLESLKLVGIEEKLVKD